VHFNSAGENVPVFDVGGAILHHKDSSRYLGIMVFYRTLNMAKSAEHMARPFLASAYRIRRFVREHALADRPHTSLWLAKMHVIPAGMYGSQVWGTGFLQAGREFSSPLSTLHLHILKGTLGVKQSTTNWAVLQECGHEPLQFYWFRSAVKHFNIMLNTRAVQNGHAIPMQEFTADLKHRMRGVWRDADLVDPTRTTTNWPPIILGLPSLFLEMSVRRLMYHGISILICPNILCAI